MPTIMGPSSLLPAVLLAVGLFAPYAYAEPSDFINQYGSLCSAYPSIPYDMHGGPVVDGLTLFQLSLNGQPKATVCPGTIMDLQVRFPSRRAYILIADGVSMTFSNHNDACINREWTNRRVNDMTTRLTIPCRPESGSLQLVVSSAGSERDSFHIARATFAVDVSCSGCASPPPSPPPPPPSPPSPPPSPPSPPTPPSPPPSPPSPPSPPAPPPAPPPIDRNCDPSTLGYDCSGKFGDVTVHWTVNTDTVPPPNDCTSTIASLDQSKSPAAGGTMIHYAVEADVQGYVSIAFAAKAGSMPDGHTVLAWVDSAGVPFIEHYYMNRDDVAPSDAIPAFTSNNGVLLRSDGSTVMCFSRTDAMDVAGRAGSAKHLMQQVKPVPSLDVAADVQYNWAIAPDAALILHTSAGGFTLNLATGASSVSSSREHWIIVHGALMSVVFIFFMPLGILLARHRSLYVDKAKPSPCWMYMHASCQLLGLVLFVAAIVISFVHLDSHSSLYGSSGEVHAVLGYVVIALFALQLVLGFVRPAPGKSTSRKVWEFAHLLSGRFLAALGIAVSFIGVAIYYDAWPDVSLAAWIAPMASVGGIFFIADVVLSCIQPKGKESGVENMTVTPSSSAGDVSKDKKQIVAAEAV